MLGTSAAGVLTRVPMGPVRDDPDTRMVFVRTVQEVIRLAQRKGIPLDEGTEAELVDWMQDMPADLKASLLVDLERGRRLEIESLHGTAVRMAREQGEFLCTCECVYAAAKLHADGPAS